MRIYMQQTDTTGKPPRFYQLMLQKDLLEGWLVIIESGYQGGPGRVQRKHFNDHDMALQAINAAKDRQINRGYRIVFAEGESLD